MEEKRQQKSLNQQGAHQMPGRGQKEDQAAGNLILTTTLPARGCEELRIEKVRLAQTP